MKTLATVIAAACSAVLFATAHAHGDGKANHGGDVGRGSDEVTIEFVMEKGTLTLYVHGEGGAEFDTAHVTGTLTLQPQQKPPQEVKLVRIGEHQYTAPGVEPARGDRMRARLMLPSGEVYESVALYSQPHDKPAAKKRR